MKKVTVTGSETGFLSFSFFRGFLLALIKISAVVVVLLLLLVELNEEEASRA